MGLAARIRQLAGGLLEPFTSRRHHFYLQQIARLEREIKYLRLLQRATVGGSASAVEPARTANGIALHTAEERVLHDEISLLRTALGQVEARIDELQARISGQQNNLTEMRESIDTFDLLRDRLRVYEICLSDIARRVDAGTAVASSTEPLSVRQGRAVQSSP